MNPFGMNYTEGGKNISKSMVNVFMKTRKTSETLYQRRLY